MSAFEVPFLDYTQRTVALGTGMLGFVSGSLGVFALLRKQSLVGDAVSHAALPGIALAFLVTGSKSPLVLQLGAALTGWLAMLLVTAVVRATRLKDDSALGLVLSVFFGFGLLLLSYLQKNVANSDQAGLKDFLFGQAATLVQDDLITIAVLGVLALLITAVFWKEFKLLSFDYEFGACLGVPVARLDVLRMVLLVVAIVVGLKVVGVVLMSAMLIAPAAAARQWTDRLGLMFMLAGLFGALSGLIGTYLSGASNVPTGPVIVLAVSALVLMSFLFAPNRGLVPRRLRQMRSRRELHVERLLGDLYALASHHQSLEHGHAAAVLETMSAGEGDVRRGLEELAARGWARRLDNDTWALTPAGRDEAQRREHRENPGTP